MEFLTIPVVQGGVSMKKYEAPKAKQVKMPAALLVEAVPR